MGFCVFLVGGERKVDVASTFMDVLEEGFTCNIFTKTHKKKQIILQLDRENRILRWKFTSLSYGQRKFKLNLGNVRQVESGRKTETLEA